MFFTSIHNNKFGFLYTWAVAQQQNSGFVGAGAQGKNDRSNDQTNERANEWFWPSECIG